MPPLFAVPPVVVEKDGSKRTLSPHVALRGGELVWGVLATHPVNPQSHLIELASLEVHLIETDAETEHWIAYQRLPAWAVRALPHVLGALNELNSDWRIVAGTLGSSAQWAIELEKNLLVSSYKAAFRGSRGVA